LPAISVSGAPQRFLQQ